ncbi:MAG: hypothetical protein ABFD64_10900 [Armatimonadota bacterium]
MYQVDDLDRVVELDQIPKATLGAPMPIVLATDYGVAIAYYLYAGKSIGQDSQYEPIAIVVFRHCYAHMFGPPNDETFNGHPLYSRGLKPYGVYEVRNSSWLRCLERMNAIHPNHDPARFMDEKRHFVFAFHDSTFECIAEGFDAEIQQGPWSSIISRMQELIEL